MARLRKFSSTVTSAISSASLLVSIASTYFRYQPRLPSFRPKVSTASSPSRLTGVYRGSLRAALSASALVAKGVPVSDLPSRAVKSARSEPLVTIRAILTKAAFLLVARRLAISPASFAKASLENVRPSTPVSAIFSILLNSIEAVVPCSTVLKCGTRSDGTSTGSKEEGPALPAVGVEGALLFICATTTLAPSTSPLTAVTASEGVLAFITFFSISRSVAISIPLSIPLPARRPTPLATSLVEPSVANSANPRNMLKSALGSVPKLSR